MQHADPLSEQAEESSLTPQLPKWRLRSAVHDGGRITDGRVAVVLARAALRVLDELERALHLLGGLDSVQQQRNRVPPTDRVARLVQVLSKAGGVQALDNLPKAIHHSQTTQCNHTMVPNDRLLTAMPWWSK